MEFCQRCGTKTNGNTYCEQCSSELFTMSDTAQKLLSEDGIPSAKDQKKIAIKKRYCVTCGKEAKIGSRYCKEHYDEIRQNARIDTHKVFNTIIIDTSNFELKVQKPVTNKHDGYNAGDFELWKTVNNKKNNNKCIICGSNSYGKPYCTKCYYQKDISIRQYNDDLKYKCKSGIIVRSLSEREISNFLTDNKILHKYEKEIKYNKYNIFTDYKQSKILHPDFYIPGPCVFKNRIIKDVYIEFWGLDNNSYLEQKKYKLKVYQSLNITLINLYKDDLIDLETQLTYKLTSYKEGIVNF